MGIKIKKKKKFRKWQKNSGAIFEKRGAIMGWERILKRGFAKVSKSDIRIVNYVLRDGEFKTMDAIMDEAYELIQENKKLGHGKLSRIRGRPQARKFAAGKREVKTFMATSPDYEVRNTGEKTETNQPIKEYRYIGE